MRLILLVILFCLAQTARAEPWTQLADCITQDGFSGGAYLYFDGTELVLQVATQTEQLDEYRNGKGTITPIPLDIAKLRKGLADGYERSLVLTKATSKESEGVVSDAALFTVSTPQTPATAPNSTVSRRGKLMRLICNRPATP